MNAVIDNKALAKKELPTKLKLLNWGKNETCNGTVYVNAVTCAVFDKNQREIGRDKAVPIDFDHCTVPGSDEFEAGKPKSIAGYGDPVLIPNDGLYLTNIEWTPLGEENARNYKDLSPAARLDENGAVVQLHSCALTPTGAVMNLMFYSAQQANQMKLMAVKDYNKADANAGVKQEGDKYVAKVDPMSAGSPASEGQLEQKADSEHAKNSELMSADEHQEDCMCAKCMSPAHAGADDSWTEDEHKAHKTLVKDLTADNDHYAKYGDVKYADETNHRYPIDTEKHIRAAWSYINMPKNAKKLGGKLSEVKSKISGAMKKIGADVKTESADEMETMSANKTNNNMENTTKLMAAVTPDIKDSKTDAEKVLWAFLAKFLGEHPEFMEQITKKSNTEEGGLKQWSTKVDDIANEIKTFKAEMTAKQTENERQTLIAQATKEGKVVALSANAIKKLDLEDLKEYVAKLSPSVPMTSKMKLLSATNVGKPSKEKAIELFNAQLARK